jgi:hypothetical protein
VDIQVGVARWATMAAPALRPNIRLRSSNALGGSASERGLPGTDTGQAEEATMSGWCMADLVLYVESVDRAAAAASLGCR